MTTYNVKTGNTFDNRTIRVFATREEASEYCNKHFAETGESAWVSQEEVRQEPVKTFSAPACH